MAKKREDIFKSYPLAFRFFDLKRGVSSNLLDFYEDYNKTTANMRHKIVDILSKYKLDFVHPSACLAGTQCKCKFWQIPFFL